MKLAKWAGWLLAGVWTCLTFLASNSPTDVKESANGWLSLPFIAQLPDALLAFASSPIVFAITFFAAGALSNWQFAKWQRKGSGNGWWYGLATEMSLLAYDVDEFDFTSDLHKLNADIDVMRVKLAKHGMPFPKQTSGVKDIRSLLPYLRRVSAHLEAGHIVEAKQLAKLLAEKTA